MTGTSPKAGPAWGGRSASPPRSHARDSRCRRRTELPRTLPPRGSVPDLTPGVRAGRTSCHANEDRRQSNGLPGDDRPATVVHDDRPGTSLPRPTRPPPGLGPLRDLDSCVGVSPRPVLVCRLVRQPTDEPPRTRVDIPVQRVESAGTGSARWRRPGGPMSLIRERSGPTGHRVSGPRIVEAGPRSGRRPHSGSVARLSQRNVSESNPSSRQDGPSAA